jgi:hypothetical protein
MIILHRKCDRIVRSSRPVIAESLYHGVFFCLPLFGKKVAELCCTNVCKTDKNSEKHLSNFSKYSIHLKHSKHPFVQKIALYRTKMTANLQNEKRPSLRAVLLQPKFSGGAFRAFGSKQANVPHAHFVLRTKQLTHPRRAFCAPRKTALKTQNRSRDPHHAPKSVADFAPRTAQIILIVFSDDMCVRKNSSHGARVAAALRAARHEAQCIPLKKRGRRKPSSFFEAVRQAPR